MSDTDATLLAAKPDAGKLPVPKTLDEAMDPAWLTAALAPVSGGSEVRSVEILEVIRTVATKVRFAVDFADGQRPAFCLKGFLGADEMTLKGGSTNVLEADFYTFIAPEITVRTPVCVNTVVNRENPQGVTIMRDLITDGAHFCSALQAFAPDQAARSLEQLARLHAARHLLPVYPWIQHRVAQLAEAVYVPQPRLQELIDGPRGEGLPAATRDAGALIAAMKALAAQDTHRPQTLVHGDSHAGNIFETADGPGLIDWQLLQKGSWALDVGYHINAVCAVAVAEREERRLLDHYLDFARGLGCDVPDRETAWEAYRGAAVYGCYLWGITQRVDPAITNVFFNRLASAVTRHDSYRLLGA
jgi:hypothetical protein